MISQALTGHVRFPFYFARFKIIEDQRCSCKKDIDNFYHYLTECPLEIQERKEQAKKLGDNIINRKPEIIKNEDTRDILEKIVQKINEFVVQRWK